MSEWRNVAIKLKSLREHWIIGIEHAIIAIKQGSSSEQILESIGFHRYLQEKGKTIEIKVAIEREQSKWKGCEKQNT